jgi:hypothetical protein
MNSSTFSEAGLIGGAGDAYLFMSSSNVGGKLYVGNATPGSSIRFYAGAFNADPNTRMIVSSSGEVGIGVTSSLGATLRVQGNVSASSYTSSVSNGVGFLGTSSWAQSSSVAISSSFATTSFFAVSASWAPGGAGPGTTFPYTGNAVITGSLQVSGSSGGLSGITGSLFGTASRALTASYAEAFTGFINFPQGLTVTGYQVPHYLQII